MTRAISVYSLWSSGAAAFYGKDSLTVEERKKEWARFEKKYPEEFAKLQRKAARENKKASPKKASPKKASPKKEAVKPADGETKKHAPRKQSLTTLEKKRATAARNLAKATQALADIEAEIRHRAMEESPGEDSSDEDSSDDDSSDEDSD
jgi:hypothetical protein